jgi:nicotinamide mononucleotide transporter
MGPLLDSSTVILQIVAQILMILMFAEQWPFWIATNVITITIWGIVIITDQKSYAYAIPTLIMWVAFLVNSSYGATNWFKKAKQI